MCNLTINHTYVIDILLPTYSLRFLYFQGAGKELGYTEDKAIRKISDICRMDAHQKGGSKVKANENHVGIKTEYCWHVKLWN